MKAFIASKFSGIKHEIVEAVHAKHGNDGLYDLYGLLLQGVDINNVEQVKVGLCSAVFDHARTRANEADLLMRMDNDSVAGLEKCRRCKSNRTRLFVKQTRSADEAESCFIRCLDCRECWVQ